MSKNNQKTFKVTQVKSAVKRPQDQPATLIGLGIRRLHQTVELLDTPSNRGMANKVSHLLRIEG